MKKLLLVITILFGLFLTSCSDEKPDVEVVKAINQYKTAVFANDEGDNGFFVKRNVNGVIGCYYVNWDDLTNKIDNSTISNGELVFNTNDEHLQTHGIKDFEILNVYIDTYYYVYISSNDKVYEYVLDYTNSSIFVLPLRFSYINFRAVDVLMDGFGQVVNARYNSLIIETTEEALLDDVENNKLINVYGIRCLFLDDNNNLVYRNIAKNNKEEDHVFIENVEDILYTSVNNNYANIITENKLYKLDFTTHTIKEIKISNVEYVAVTDANNYITIISNNNILIYNYRLELIKELPINPSDSDIVGLCVSFMGSSNPKKLVITTAHLDGNVLYRKIEEIKLS